MHARLQDPTCCNLQTHRLWGWCWITIISHHASMNSDDIHCCNCIFHLRVTGFSAYLKFFIYRHYFAHKSTMTLFIKLFIFSLTASLEYSSICTTERMKFWTRSATTNLFIFFSIFSQQSHQSQSHSFLHYLHLR